MFRDYLRLYVKGFLLAELKDHVVLGYKACNHPSELGLLYIVYHFIGINIIYFLCLYFVFSSLKFAFFP